MFRDFLNPPQVICIVTDIPAAEAYVEQKTRILATEGKLRKMLSEWGIPQASGL
jgi:hypothetical protein